MMQKLNLYTFLAFLGLSSGMAMAQFVEQTHGLTSGMHHLQCFDGNNCYASSNSGSIQIIKTTDGKTWNSAIGDLPSNVIVDELTCVNNNTCILVDNNNGDLYRTTNGGTNWSKIPSNMAVGDLQFFNSSVGVSDNSGIILTTNQGETWYSINQPPTAGKGYFYSPQFGYVISGSGVIYRTKNGGDLWEKVTEDTSDAGYYFTNLEIVNEQVAFAIGFPNKIFRTINGGDKWVELNNPYSANSVGIFYAADFIDEKNGYVVGGQSHILKTTDGGETWIDESFTFNLGFEAVQVADLNNVYVLGTGYLLKNDSANFVGLFDLHQEVELGKIYPNPAKEYVTIELNEFNNSMTFSLFDLSGQKVKEVDLNTKKTVIENEGLESGMYVYKITNEKGLISTGKLNFN